MGDKLDHKLDQFYLQTLANVVQSGVTGALIADAHGLCIGAKGNAASKSSGFYKAMIDRGKLLFDGELPQIIIETESQNIFVHNQDNLTIVIHKLP